MKGKLQQDECGFFFKRLMVSALQIKQLMNILDHNLRQLALDKLIGESNTPF